MKTPLLLFYDYIILTVEEIIDRVVGRIKKQILNVGNSSVAIMPRKKNKNTKNVAGRL